jgi:hypothetical protein
MIAQSIRPTDGTAVGPLHLYGNEPLFAARFEPALAVGVKKP